MIVYALVARGATILAENTGSASASGNFEVVARMVLSKLEEDNKNSNSRQSVEVETHTYHVLPHNGLRYVVLVESSFPPKLAFALLHDTQDRFNTMFEPSDWEQAIAQSLNAEFSGVLSLLMAKYNRMQADGQSVDAGDEKVRRVREQIEDVKDVMRTNIDSLLNRGERIELLVDTTERLTQASFKFQESATRLKNQHWWNSRKNKIMLAVALVFIVWLLASTWCGRFDLWNC